MLIQEVEGEFKAGFGRTDGVPMVTPSDIPAWAQRGNPRRTRINGVISYILFADEQLINEADRLKQQLKELTFHPGGSPGVGLLAASIKRELEGIANELMRRARSRHPSSCNVSSRLRFRSMPWPPQAG